MRRLALPAILLTLAACSDQPATFQPEPASAPSLTRSADVGLGQRDIDVVVASNAPDGNALLAFTRNRNGALEPVGSWPTGGLGTGGGLGDQGGVISHFAGRLVLAVNAGSDDVSTFFVDKGSLKLLGRTASGGDEPISVTAHGSLVYVLNDGASRTSPASASAATGRLRRFRAAPVR